MRTTIPRRALLFAFVSALLLFGLALSASAQPTVYTPTASDGATASSDSDALCLGCSVEDLENVIGAKNLAARMNIPIGVLAGSRIRVDLPAAESANTRPGFVISDGGGILDIGLLDRITIRTYFGDVLQEEASSGAGLLVNTWPNGRTRLALRAKARYDALEIEIAGAALLLTEVDVFYAVITRPTALDRIVALADDGATASGSTGGLCFGCTVTNVPLAIDPALASAATLSVPLGVAGTASLAVDYGSTLPAQTWTGFWLSSSSDLLNVAVLGSITIEALDGSTVVASGSGGDLRISQRPDGLSFVRIRTTTPFDAVRIESGSLVGLSFELNVHQAMTVLIDPTLTLDAPPLASAPAARADVQSGASLTLSAPAPNPFRGATRLTLTAGDAASVHVAAYDVLGREVAVLHDGPVTSGGETVRFDATGLAPGTYVVRATAEHVSAQRVVTVAR